MAASGGGVGILEFSPGEVHGMVNTGRGDDPLRGAWSRTRVVQQPLALDITLLPWVLFSDGRGHFL